MKKYPVTEDTDKKAQLLSIAGDSTRIRILCLMFEQKKVCVSDIAEGIGSSVQNTSQHLQIMKDVGLFTTERDGNSICYKLVVDGFTKKLRKIICS